MTAVELPDDLVELVDIAARIDGSNRQDTAASLLHNAILRRWQTDRRMRNQHTDNKAGR